MDDRRSVKGRDRRAHSRGGRRDGERAMPWYLRRKMWLAIGSLMFAGWRRVRSKLHS